MASGFVQRWKGKVNAAQLWLAGTQITASGADINTLAGGATVTTSTSAAAPVTLTRNAGLDILAPVALTGGSIYRLPAPAAGVTKTLQYSTINGSTIVFITLSTAGAITLSGVGSTGSTAAFGGSGGSTLTNTIKSTQSCTIELMGISTSQWLFSGILPSTVGALTFSTST